MSGSQFGAPVLLGQDGSGTALARRRFVKGEADSYDEAWLQDLLYKTPNVIPIDQIDRAYEPLVPICRELGTPAGPLDVLYATPKGRLVLLEAKLWRNPEARRTVVGQILDYAKELSRWSYEDLQRQVSMATKRKGNVLYDLVRERYADADEAAFVDEVTRSLRIGKFMLLIVGDGIREGVGAIANFLEHSGTLQFTLGLVEIAIFDMPNGGRLVQPRVLAKTVEIPRTVIVLKDGRLDAEASEEPADERLADPVNDERKARGLAFWTGFLRNLKLDDQSQPIPDPKGNTNLFFSMPPKGGMAWISCWIGYYGGNEGGVYLTFVRGPKGDAVYEYLEGQREAIEADIGLGVTWESKNGKHSISVRRQFKDVLGPEERVEIHRYLGDAINRFVNAFRHRLAKYEAEALEA